MTDAVGRSSGESRAAVLYFAYGSNMDWSQMRGRCPSAQFVCVAKLPDHHLAFTRKSQHRGCGVGDAVPAKGSAVWGVIFQIDETDTGRLDQSEGFSPGRAQNSYVREERQALENGDPEKPMNAWVYFANRQPNPPLPNAEYKRLIVEGARYWHLPEQYIKELERIEVTQ